jgi:DHA3 family macrolide efflux protein-like MFS transporter
MMVDVVTAILAIVPLLFVEIPQPKRDDLNLPNVNARPSIWADLRAGFQYVWIWPGMMILIAGAMLFKIALTPAFSLLPLLVSKHFNGNATQLSILEAGIGIGIVLGGLLLSVWGGFRRKILTTLMGLSILGLIMFVLGFVPGNLFWLAIGCCFLLGLMIPLVDGPLFAVLQTTVDPQIQGRVFTLIGSLVSITSPFSLVVAGPISDWIGLQVWYIIAGVLVSATGLIFFFIPAIVNIEDHGKEPVKKVAYQPQDKVITLGENP